jgi:alkyl hydroperoxide reductase subunit F
MAVPTVFLNGEPFGQGRMTLEEIIAKLDTGAGARAAEQLAAKEPFDVLVVGGGPAGAAAAIYAARKGIRTGVVAERFGGQVLDTLASRTSSRSRTPRARSSPPALEQHVREYDVDIMNLQRPKRSSPTVDRTAEVPGQRRDAAREDGRHRDRRPLARDERPGRAGVRGNRASPIARTATDRCSRASASR